MSHLTKDQLRDAIESSGHDAPPTAARKEELISIYREKVNPSRDAGGELLFSDDDGSQTSSPGKPRRRPRQSLSQSNSNRGSVGKVSPRKAMSMSNYSMRSPAAVTPKKKKSSMEDDEAEDEMEDDELFRKLKQFGVDVGPVVDSTRDLYRKKLAELMSIGGGGGAAMTNGEDLVTGGDLPDKTGKKSPKRATIEFDQFSADEDTAEENNIAGQEEEEEEESSDEQPAPVVTVRTSPRVAAKQQKQQQEQQAEEQSRGGTLRQRFADDAGPEQREKDRFTPTPRRSIHSYKVTETTRQTLTKTADGRELARDYSYQKETYRDGVKTGQQDKRHLVLSLLPKICMLMVFLAAAYYTVKHFHGEEKLQHIFDQLSLTYSSQGEAPDETPTPTPAPQQPQPQDPDETEVPLPPPLPPPPAPPAQQTPEEPAVDPVVEQPAIANV